MSAGSATTAATAGTSQAAAGSSQAVAVVTGYVFGGIGVLLVLLLTCVILRRVRWRAARKYIKEQSERSIPMQKPLSKSDASAPPPRDSASGGGNKKPPAGSRPASGGDSAAASAGDRPRSRYIEARQRRLQLRQQARQQKELSKQRKKEAKQLARAQTALPLGRSTGAATPPANTRWRAQSSGGGERARTENPIYYITGLSLGYSDHPDAATPKTARSSSSAAAAETEELGDSWSSRQTVLVEVHARSVAASKERIIELDAGIEDGAQV